VNQGLYAEIVPRSSLSKSGYMLANSIGIIDCSYKGNLYIALTKIDNTMPDLTLPFRCCQLIFREQIHVDLEEVTSFEEQTSRGSGGFGSTGN
jgi:dUTP pyrophosphatase